MPAIQPTVGRSVYYKSYGTPKGEYKSEDRAAIVTAVHFKDKEHATFLGEVESIDLCVFNPTGLFFNQNVKQGQEGGQWDWMPYQKEQQASVAQA